MSQLNIFKNIKFATNKYTKVFEIFILKPLWLCYLLAMIFSLIQQEWLIGIFLFLMLFYLGWIGGAVVNKGKTFKELSKDTLFEGITSDEDNLTQEKAWHLGETVAYTSYAIALTAIVIAFKYGYKFYISIPVGIVVWFIFRPISIFITVSLTEKLK